MLKLLIGNRRFSSWSMRAWVLMRQLGFDFETEVVPYTRPDWGQFVRSLHPAGTVPVLLADGVAVGDSLAIAETLAELSPDAGVWPADRFRRAHARALCAEMHSSFAAIREECAFDLFRDGETRPLSASGRVQLARVDAILCGVDTPEGFLCGRFCAADAFYIPLALRVLQYGLRVSPGAQAYLACVAALPSVQEWSAQAAVERAWPALSPGGRPYHRAVVSGDDALRLARRWVEARNTRNPDALLELFCEGAVLVSPEAERLTGQACVEGKAALRSYWSKALDGGQPPGLRLEAVDWDAASSTVLVLFEAGFDGRRCRAAERWAVDPAGRIRRSEAYCGAGV